MQLKMKNNITYYLIITALTLSLSGCEDYLNIPAEAAIYEEDVFKTYEAFQGYQDELINTVIDYNRHGAGGAHFRHCRMAIAPYD